jgi:Trk K+ transport system NAD-binding subunit
MVTNGRAYSQLINKPKKNRPISQRIRALFQTYIALWHEFKKPIIYFFIATVGLGMIYGELHYLSYPDEFIPYLDRPYMMLQMMVIETPDISVPPQLHLIAFWYILPLLFIYIVAEGASEFIRVFFSSDERRRGWMEAIASTYRNHIIVFGAGHVGLRVVIHLVQMGCEVVVIDNDPDEGVAETLDPLHIPIIIGDGLTSGVMERAGIKHASSFIACTGNDHLNLEAIMKARDANEHIRIVSRIWDDKFANQIKRFMNVQTIISSSDLSAPAFAGAALGVEITQTLTVNDVDYSMIRIEVTKGSFLENRNIGELQETEKMDIVLYENGTESTIQPHHDVIVQAGDTLVLFAEHAQILSIVSRNQHHSKKFK